MANTIKIKRGTRTQLNAAASASGLVQGEPYLITDENRLAVGLSATTYAEYALAGHDHDTEYQPLNDNLTELSGVSPPVATGYVKYPGYNTQGLWGFYGASSYGRDLISQASITAMVEYLELSGTMAVQSPSSVSITGGSIAGTTLAIASTTDLSADLADADEVVVYDTSASANRKSALSRFWTYITSKLAGSSPEVAGLNLGHASDTTLTRSAAGQVTIEGVQIATASNSMTLSNKSLAAGTTISRAGGTEGGELGLQVPASGTNLSSDILLDISGDYFRLFEAGGTNRGARFPIDDCSASVGSNFVIDNLTQTLTNKTLTDPAIIGAIKEDVYAITDGAAFEIDPSNGTIQTITLGNNRTPKATNFAAGESVTLMVLDGSAYTLTWTDTTFGTSGVVWVGGTAPTLDTTKYTVIELWKVGSQVYGALVGAA